MMAHKITVPLSDGTIAEIDEISPELLERVRLYFGYDEVSNIQDREIVRYIIEATRSALNKNTQEEQQNV